MSMNRTKKIILSISITFAVCAGFAAYYYQERGPIYTFNAARDTQQMMDIFHQNWHWLLASDESSPAFMLKNLTYDTNPMHFGKLHFKVMRIDNKVAGFTAYYMETPEQGRLLFLAVGHAFRGHGYGKVLAQCAMKELFAMGAQCIRLWTRISNLPAQKIYRELNFTEIFEDNGYILFEYWPTT